MGAKYSINIQGGTVGAVAIGSGATATSSTGGPAARGSLRFTFEARGATRAQIARWLRTAADCVEDEHHDALAAKTDGSASRAWSLEADDENDPGVLAPGFFDAIEAVCRRHNVSISHEDGHGGFIIEAFDSDNMDWLRAATDDR